MSFVPPIDWGAVPRHSEHRQLGERPRWFNGAPVTGLAVDPRGRYLLTASSRFLRLFWASSGEVVLTFERPGNGGTVYDRAGFSPDGRRVLAHIGGARDDDGALGIWDVETGALERRLPDPPVGRVSAIDPRRARVLARGKDAGALLVDADDGTSRLLVPRPMGGLGGAAFLSETRVMGMPSMAGHPVHCWDTATGAVVWERDFENRSSAAAAARDRDWFAMGGSMGGATVHDAATGDLRFTLDPAQADRGAWVVSLDATPDGRFLLAVSKQEVVVWDMATRKSAVWFPGDGVGEQVGAISPDGRRFFLGDSEARLSRHAIGDSPAEESPPDGKGHRAAIEWVGWSEDGRPRSRDVKKVTLEWPPFDSLRSLRVKDAAWAAALEGAIDSHIQSRHRDDHESLVTLVANESFAVSLSSWGGVEVWGRDAKPRFDFLIGMEKGGLTGRYATALALHPDGRRVAVATTRPDAPIQIWDAVTGLALLVLEGHEGVPRALSFSADGSLLLSGGDDRVVRAYHLA